MLVVLATRAQFSGSLAQWRTVDSVVRQARWQHLYNITTLSDAGCTVDSILIPTTHFLDGLALPSGQGKPPVVKACTHLDRQIPWGRTQDVYGRDTFCGRLRSVFAR